MNKKIFAPIVMCTLISTMNVNAQIGNILRQKAEDFAGTAINAADNKIDKTLEKEATEFGENSVEKAAENIEGQSERASSAISTQLEKATAQSEAGISALEKMGTVTLPHNDKYDFKGEIVMETKYYENGGDKESGVINMVLWMGAGNDNFGVVNEFVSGDVEEENLNLITIADNTNKCYIMLMGGETQEEGGMGIISAIPEPSAETASSTASTSATNITKTGKTKTIAGYKCEEWVYVDDESRSSMWVANDAKFKFSKDQLSRAGMATYYSKVGEDGFVMGYDGYVDDKLVMSMVVTKIDENSSKSFSLASYYMMQGQ